MSRSIVFALALAVSLHFAPSGAAAEERVALLIGNSGYTSLGRLDNPVNDMVLLGKTLRRLGFEVIERADADLGAMKRAIKDFGRRLDRAGRDAVGLFYYAGHGVQVRGTNYLIPLGTEMSRESDVEIEAVSADWVLTQMEYAGNRINFLILDACRNNPLTRGFRSTEQGLSKMDAPSGTLIAYSTAPGGLAVDGEGANSPYTEALAETITQPGLVAEGVFRKVRVAVLEATEGAQEPWESTSLTNAFYFNPDSEPPSGRTTDEPAGRAEASGLAEAELLFWESIKDGADPALYRSYLERYPDGVFADIAKARLSERQATQSEAATREEDGSATTPPPPVTGSDSEQTEPDPAGDGPERTEPDVPESEKERADADDELEVAQAAVLRERPAPVAASRLVGRWEGRYRCSRDVIGMALEVEPIEDDRIAALFEFFPVAGAPSFPPGSFRVTGTYDRASGRLRLDAGDWVDRPWGFPRHDLMGVVMKQDGLLIEGRILSAGCSEFSVRRWPEARPRPGDTG